MTTLNTIIEEENTPDTEKNGFQKFLEDNPHIAGKAGALPTTPDTEWESVEKMAQQLMDNPQFQSSDPITVLSLLVSALSFQ